MRRYIAVRIQICYLFICGICLDSVKSELLRKSELNNQFMWHAANETIYRSLSDHGTRGIQDYQDMIK